MKEKIQFLTKWLREIVKQTKAKGLVVGVSGGIDSAVVAYLIKKALPKKSLAVVMPCKSSNQDRDDALDVIHGCDIDYIEINLTPTHQTLFGKIERNLHAKDEWKESKSKLIDANLRARLRMATLYSIAGNYQYLVVGTDNAAEWYTGYFTKYGDGGVDLVPLVHLTKGEVREMAKELGIPDHIIEKAPSAGLWEGQTDEKEMGISYDTIDQFLKGKKIAKKDEEIIKKLHERSEHKRHLAISPPAEIFIEKN